MSGIECCPAALISTDFEVESVTTDGRSTGSDDGRIGELTARDSGSSPVYEGADPRRRGAGGVSFSGRDREVSVWEALRPRLSSTGDPRRFRNAHAFVPRRGPADGPFGRRGPPLLLPERSRTASHACVPRWGRRVLVDRPSRIHRSPVRGTADGPRKRIFRPSETDDRRRKRGGASKTLFEEPTSK